MTYDAAVEQVMEGPEGSIVVTYRVRKEGDQFVAECIELGVASCGDTIDDAFRMIDDAVTLYLNSLEEEGERERVFKERGIIVFKTPRAEAGRDSMIAVGLDEYVKRQEVPIHLLQYA